MSITMKKGTMLMKTFLRLVSREFGWTVTALLLSIAMPLQAGENLVLNPSFETVNPADPNGQIFENWEHNIPDPPAAKYVSSIAHSGGHSCLLVGDVLSKTGIYTPDKALLKPEPGRYRSRFYLRGMDIGIGEYGGAEFFSCGPEGKFFGFKKTGNFGWTPLTYVFDIKPGVKASPYRIRIGLTGGGRLWVDDASVEKVDESVALTPEPVWGDEEVPIKPTGPLGENPIRCSACLYLNNAASKTCFACGVELPHNAGGKPKDLPREKVIAELANGSIAPFIKGNDLQVSYSTNHVANGKGGISVEKTFIGLAGTFDWSGYNNLCFEAYNESDKPAPLELTVRDAVSHGYWGQANITSVILPGQSTVRIPINTYRGEKARPGSMLLLDQIQGLVLRVVEGKAVLSNFRLERVDPPATFEGLNAFKVGTFDSPSLPGFTLVTARTLYDSLRGFGWVDATAWRAMNVLQPDPLVQSFACMVQGKFRIDLPNGKYHGVYCIESPGGYWGEAQTYESRQVTCNGQVVLDEKQDFDKFLARYFRNAHREDLPGEDVFAQYVQTTCPAREFDATVTDGKLEIGFKGETWANSLSYLVVYPEAKAAQGQRFMDAVTQMRREVFSIGYKQIEPKRSEAPKNDYVVFTRPLDIPINAYDGPTTGEVLAVQASLQLSVAGHEESALVLAVQPSANPLGAVDLAISPFVNEKGQKLDPAFFEPGWIDYRLSRVEMDGSVYTVSPRYWHPTPAPAAPGVTRCFWVRTHTPAGAIPGKYSGTITIRPASGKARPISVVINVLPFDLDSITDVAVGPIGYGISVSFMGDPMAKAWNDKLEEKILDAIAQTGSTTLTGIPSLKAKASQGKIELDTAKADQEMQLLRAKGFALPIITYGAEGANLGYRFYGSGSGPDEAAAKNAGFPNAVAYLKALYTAIDQHAVEQHWLPVVWNLCDEPIPGEALNNATANAQAHHEAVAGLKLTTCGGFTSMEGDPKDVHAGLLKALPMSILNGHDTNAINLAKSAGNQWAFYNGASRWTYGRYLKSLVTKYQCAARVSWHFNIVAGDPYYALDCREDDYCWYNTDEQQAMVPSMLVMRDILPGLTDYRYLATLQRLLKEKPKHPAAGASQKVFDAMMTVQPGVDRYPEKKLGADGLAAQFAQDRQQVAQAICDLLR